jgi:hypothetical protein
MFFVTPSTKMRATLFRRSPHLCCKASPKWPQLSPRGLSKTVGRHTEAKREWNEVVSTKNMRLIESKESQKTPPAAQKCGSPGWLHGSAITCTCTRNKFRRVVLESCWWETPTNDKTFFARTNSQHHFPLTTSFFTL